MSGAVATYTAAVLGSSRVAALVLIDPVDDSSLSTLHLLATASIKGAQPPTLIISTPYGGSSRYYSSTVFDSACAPPSRGPKAFYKTLLEKKVGCAFYEFTDIGHLQLLDDRGSLSFASACAAGTSRQQEQRVKEEVLELVSWFILTHTSSSSLLPSLN